MYSCTLSPKKDEYNTTVERAYQNSEKNLKTVFRTTYAMGLLKTIIKKLACDRSLCFILTQERMLLFTINEYKGSIQVGQVPLQKPQKPQKTKYSATQITQINPSSQENKKQKLS
jgi:excinuclease UvrABC nuclease subunit